VTPAAALAILGLERDASKSQIKEAYRDLAKVWHPDRFQNDPRLRAKAEATFKQVNTAYEALTGYRPSVRSTPTSGRKARPRARQEATPPEPGSTRRPEPRDRPAPPRSSPHMILAGVLIWGIGVLFGVLLVFTLLSEACSEPRLRW